jgi:pimeloyl-ACP methyl ester carboxylesterase
MQLNYQLLGQGPPLLVLHGLFGSLDNWRTLAKRMGAHYSTYIIDQRNHGRSPHSDYMDYPTLAADVAEFCETHGLTEVTLLGHSMGGKTAMQLVKDHPALVDQLIVVDMSPVAYPPHHSAIIEGLQQIDLGQLASRTEANELLQAYVPEEGQRQFLLKGLVRDSAGGFKWRFNLDAIARHYDRILAGITFDWPFDRPTLFMRGEHSPYLAPENQEPLDELFMNYELVTLEGAGHWIHAEKPEAFLAALGNFLGVEF